MVAERGTGGGGVFSLSPPNAQVVMSGQSLADSIFPPGYVSVASQVLQRMCELDGTNEKSMSLK